MLGKGSTTELHLQPLSSIFLYETEMFRQLVGAIMDGEEEGQCVAAWGQCLVNMLGRHPRPRPSHLYKLEAAF
jgi:hypothetical protein